jgi:glycosyltransferase involved in cell wall biosynthesis
MKLIYFHLYRGSVDSGVNKKVLSQVHSLNEIGVPSKLFLICENETPVPRDPCVVTERYVPSFFSRFTPVGIILRERFFHLTLRHLIDTLSENDIIYLRIPYPTIFSSLSFRKKRACKIVIEYQSIEPVEYRKKKMFGYLILDLLFGKSLREKADAIVGVTEEITRYQLSRGGNREKPHYTLGNGFDVLTVPVRDPPKFDGSEFHLLCVADVSIWHGLDRLLQGIRHYPGTVKIKVHVAGDGKDLPRLKKMIADLGLSDMVIFHGFTKDKDLDRLFNICHIAIGSLGIHRLGLKEASTLKVREYCARGIPFIYECRDPDFPADFRFSLKIPADESPVDMESVIRFIIALYQDPQVPGNMRQYALEHLESREKMQELKQFLNSLIVKK